MRIIYILPEALNIDQAVNIYVYKKENPQTFVGILMLYFIFDMMNITYYMELNIRKIL